MDLIALFLCLVLLERVILELLLQLRHGILLAYLLLRLLRMYRAQVPLLYHSALLLDVKLCRKLASQLNLVLQQLLFFPRVFENQLVFRGSLALRRGFLFQLLNGGYAL